MNLVTEGKKGNGAGMAITQICDFSLKLPMVNLKLKKNK